MRHAVVAIFSAGVIAAAAVVSASAAPAASPPFIADSDASAFFQNSAWAYENKVESEKCKGTGALHRLPAGIGTGHGTYSCIVQTYDGKKGTVAAKALGPESLRITSVSGGLKPDAGVGAIPSGPLTMDDDQAESALQDSPWGSKAQIDDVFCSGIGPYKGTLDTTGYFFGAFDCATFKFGQRSAQVIVAVTGSTVRVTKTFTR